VCTREHVSFVHIAHANNITVFGNSTGLCAVQKTRNYAVARNLVADRIFSRPFSVEPQTKYTIDNNVRLQMQRKFGPLNVARDMQQPVSHAKHQALQTKQIILMCDHLDHKGHHLVSTARQHGRESPT
jgi:hypothetical protein